MNAYLEKFREFWGEDHPSWMGRAVETLRIQDAADKMTGGFAHRQSLVEVYAWAVPNEEAIETIKKWSPDGVVEIGAGRGYWAALLAKAGVDVVAYDKDPPPEMFFDVKRGMHRHARKHRDRTLFLSWPPYATDMAYQSVIAHRGDVLVYIGEGWGGCNANDDFHEYVDSHYKIAETIEIPQWPGLHDELEVYVRNRTVKRASGRRLPR